MSSVAVELKPSLNFIDSLPAMPVLAQKLLALPLNTDEGETQLLKLISQDPQISAKLVGLSNTALFGAPGIISSIRDATMRLGLTTVKSVSIGMATSATLKKQPEGKLKSADLWVHSMAIAIGMRIIAKRMPSKIRPSDDQVFLAGLLHDIGYNVLSFLDTPLSDALHESIENNPDKSLMEIEEIESIIHHGELGAQLGIHWGLPSEIISVIRHHHSTEPVDEEIEQALINLIQVTEKLLPGVGITECAVAEVTAGDWEKLSIDEFKVDDIMEEIMTAPEQAKQIANEA